MIITPARREQRLADLRQRTDLPVKRVEIGRINFLNDTAARWAPKSPSPAAAAGASW